MSWSDDVLSGLSEETMKALREFALQQGVSLDPDAPDDPLDVLSSVQQHFSVQDREEIFHSDYQSKDGSRHIVFDCKGVKRELGQTLNSTGLTIWRAAEHLCQYFIDNPEHLKGKSACELGAGLGLVSILVDKMDICTELVVTDGDEDTIALLIENQVENGCSFSPSYLYWGEHEDFVSEHESGFDVVFAADVIYEAEQIAPLIATVSAILKKSGEFILAFARRNVPMDKVIAEAESKGFQYTILDETAEGVSMEPIYRFVWKK